MFEHLRAAQFVFQLRAKTAIHLPTYKGSALRGGFGQALKEVSCALRRQECRSCLLKGRCVYLYLFETPPPPDTEMMRLYPAAPHPFVIEPPLEGESYIEPGAPLSFGLTLIGRAVEYLPYFVYAFMHLGERGLGRGRGRFEVERVLAATDDGVAIIFDEEGKSLCQPPPFNASELVAKRVAELMETETLTIDFQTPTRIKFDGHLVDKPQFHHLVRALLRRLSSLSYFHCGERLELDFRGLVDRAAEIRHQSENLRWYDWERYSNRQQQRMSLGGFTGRASYSGHFRDFLPLLAWGEIVHLGKAASFGLGKYRIESQER